MKLDSLKLKAEEIFFLQEYLQPIHNITLANFTRLGQEEKLKYSVMSDVSKTVTNKRSFFNSCNDALQLMSKKLENTLDN